jgi:hypothetical protein
VLPAQRPLLPIREQRAQTVLQTAGNNITVRLLSVARAHLPQSVGLDNEMPLPVPTPRRGCIIPFTALFSLCASRFLCAGQSIQCARSLVCIRFPIKTKVNHELPADDGPGNTAQVYS